MVGTLSLVGQLFVLKHNHPRICNNLWPVCSLSWCTAPALSCCRNIHRPPSQSSTSYLLPSNISSNIHLSFSNPYFMSNPRELHTTTTQDCSKEDVIPEKTIDEEINQQDEQTNMDLFRTDSLVDGTLLSSRNQTPQYDAFLQSLSNNITSYLSEYPKQNTSKPTKDSQKSISSRPEKPTRIQRKRPKRVKRTKP